MRFGSLHYAGSEGIVRFTKSFDDSPDDIIKLDILSDWIGDLKAEYNRVHAITFPTDESPTLPDDSSPTSSTD